MDDPRPGRPARGSSTATHTAVARQLMRDITVKLLDPLDALLDSTGGTNATAALRRQLAADTEMWAAQVTGSDEELAAETAVRVISAIYQDGPEFSPPASWWQTSFGGLVARRFGHPTAAIIPATVASAMLGITRQGTHDLVKRGKLQQDPTSSGILVSSVRNRLNSF